MRSKILVWLIGRCVRIKSGGYVTDIGAFESFAKGWRVKDKRTNRLYRDVGWSNRPKLPQRDRAWRNRQVRPAEDRRTEAWAVQFLFDQMLDRRQFRILTVVDCQTREARLLISRASFRVVHVTEAQGTLVRFRGRSTTRRR